MMVDPRALKDNPDQTRRSKSSPAGRCLLLASIKAVGIVQPPVILPERDGGNGYVIHFGHRRVAQAIAAELAEIHVLVADSDADHDAMRALVENVAREPLNPVDLWRSIERLVALGWTEESIALALARCRCARSASSGCSPMCCRRCSIRWRRATCPASRSSASSPPRSTTTE